jgi:hypothetical protein
MLEKFDENYSYQLTWAEWLNGMLVDCCDDIAEAYGEQGDASTDKRDATVLSIANTITDLAVLSANDGEDTNDFAIRMRAAFDANQATENAIDVIESGITIEDPPADCQ